MFEVKPWDEIDRKFFRRITKDRIFYTNDIDLSRSLGRRYPSLFDKENGFMDIGRIKKTNSSMIALRPNSYIMPLPPSITNTKKNFRFKFYKIY